MTEKSILIVGEGNNRTILPTELLNKANATLGNNFVESFINSQVPNDIEVYINELLDFVKRQKEQEDE